eukprot:COSAG05_NODE_15480_length_368_cov_1.193309_1_plen_86_part_01
MIGKAVASILTYPYQLSKIMLQSQTQKLEADADLGTETGHRYRGAWDCMRGRWAAQGLSGLYAGAFPQYAPISAPRSCRLKCSLGV